MTVNSPIINYNDGFLSINHVFDILVFPAVPFFNANQKDEMMPTQKIWEESH